MALKKNPNKIITTPIEPEVDRRNLDRDYDNLIAKLYSDDGSERRWAARDLTEYPQSVDALLERVKFEKNQSVLECIFSTLQTIGGETVVTGLINFLESREAVVRNLAIEVLQSMPHEIADHIEALLSHDNSDVRIFAIDVLRVLAHPRQPEWLVKVLHEDNHVNVVGSAIDLLAEVGSPEVVPELEAVEKKFSEYKFIHFAVKMAKTRILSE